MSRGEVSPRRDRASGAYGSICHAHQPCTAVYTTGARPTTDANHRPYIGRGDTTDTRHWPLDLIELHSIITHPLVASTTPAKHPTLRLILHLSQPPADKLLMPNTVEACQTQFINALKEADFVRWRNTNKVTNMRRADLESGWEGIFKGALRY